MQRFGFYLTDVSPQTILRLEEKPERSFSPSTLRQIQEDFPINLTLSQAATSGYLDKRETIVFAIAPDEVTGSSNLPQIGISCEHVQGFLIVGVHVIDASFYVAKDSLLDKEIRERVCDMPKVMQSNGDSMPSVEVAGLFPDHLATKVCPLVPHRDTVTLAMYLQLDLKGELQRVLPKKSLINPQTVLTYKQIQVRGVC